MSALITFLTPILKTMVHVNYTFDSYPFPIDLDELSFITILEDFKSYSDRDKSVIVDLIYNEPKFRDALRDKFFDAPSPRDLFVVSLANLRESGDIDVLIRALNWQHNDIAYLTSRLVGYERNLEQLDSLRIEVARLKDSANQLRERNSELIRALRESNTKIPKSMSSRKKIIVKPPKPRL